MQRKAAYAGMLITLFLLPLISYIEPVHAMLVDRPAMKLFDNYYLNWSGYFVTGTGFAYANATWTVPSVSTNTSGDSASWVGIGGVNGNTLIQTGTSQDCTTGTTAGEAKYHGLIQSEMNKNAKGGSGGGGGKGGSSSCTPVYYAWWEILPQAETKITTITVSPGDKITAYVLETSTNVWTISLQDVSATHGVQTFTTSVSYSTDQSTAEAIMERPSVCLVKCQLTNLADFGQITFTNAVAGTTIGSTQGQYFDTLAYTIAVMVDNSGRILAQPSTLSDPGTFTDTWKRSS